jgi:hypothetical protein
LFVRDRSRIAAVIPAYQEEKHVGEVAQRTRAQLENVLVVDDGSTDATAERARSSGVDVVVHPQNRGKGESIKTGLRYWLERGSEYVVIPRRRRAAFAGRNFAFCRQRRVGVERENFHWLAHERHQRDAAAAADCEPLHERLKISRVCGQQIPDTQCGFRMLHRDIIPEVLSGASRFEYETEMLIIASRKGHHVASVPITTVYSDEVSSINPVRDTLRFFKLMRRYRNL